MRIPKNLSAKTLNSQAMIKFFLWLVLFFIAIVGFSQKNINQLRQELRNETRLEQQHAILLELGARYQFFHFDSAMYFHTRAYNAAVEMGRSANRADLNKIKQLKADARLGMLRVYDSHGDNEKVTEYGAQLLPVAKELQDTVMIISAYLSLGNSKFRQGIYPEAITYYQRAAELSEKSGNDLYLARVNQNLGSLFYHQGNFAASARATSVAAELYKKLGNTLGMASTHLLLGNLVADAGQPERALEHYRIALKGFEETNHPTGKYNSLLNIGTTFHDLRKFEEAKDYFNRANAMAVSLNDPDAIARTLHNIGLSYLLMDRSQHSLQFFYRALDVARNNGLQLQQAHTFGSLARAYNNLGRHQQAIRAANQSLELAIENGMVSAQETAYRNLFIANQSMGNWRQALEHHTHYKLLSDSVNRMESNVAIARIETQFQNRQLEEQLSVKEFELENQRLELQEKNLRLQLERTQKILIATGFVAVLVILAFVQASSRKRKQLNNMLIKQNAITEEANEALKRKNTEIASQSDKINKQKTIIEEKNLALVSSINYALTIQKSMMPNAEQLDAMLGECFVFFQPKEIVSGDFYWVGQLRNKTLLVVGDCAGHGVPGAFISIKVLSYLNDFLMLKGDETTGTLLNNFRTYIAESLNQANAPRHKHEIVEMAIVAIDRDKGEIEFSGARLPLVISSNSPVLLNGVRMQPETGICYRIKPDPMALVYSEAPKPFTTQKVKVEKGSMIYLATDGFADQFGGTNGDRFTYQRLYNLLSDHFSLETSIQKNALIRESASWRNGHTQIDDITIVGARI